MSDTQSSVPGSPASQPVGSYDRWLIGIPAALLLAEILLLTHRVEFRDRRLALVASAEVCYAFIFGAALLLTLTPPRRMAPFLILRTSLSGLLLGLIVQFVLFAALLEFSQKLEAARQAMIGWSTVLAWSVLAMTVALSAVLIIVRLRSLCRLLWMARLQLLIAVVVSSGLALGTPLIQRAWPVVCPPVIGIGEYLLETYPGHAQSGWYRGSIPVLGVPGLRLLVTRHCAELESIVAFWLLAIAVYLRDRTEVRLGRFAACVSVATLLLYVLNAFRLQLLILIGVWLSAETCVRVAHSRLSSVVYLALSLGLVHLCVRWSRTSHMEHDADESAIPQ